MTPFFQRNSPSLSVACTFSLHILILLTLFTCPLYAAQKAYSQGIPILGNPNNMYDQKRYVGDKKNIPTYRNLKYISARSAIIIDAKSNKVLYARKPDDPRQPASTIKVLTGILALENLKPNEFISVSRKAACQPRSKLYLDSRKSYLVDDLIHGVLLGSANDASVALAEKIAGSEKEFSRQMTAKAQQWGAKNTICKTASGLTAKGQQSTVRDLATIFMHAMKNPAFAEKMQKNRIKTSYGQTVYTHNKALWQVKGAVAGKTGYTNAARQTYVGLFKKDDAEIVIALMGSETMWKDVRHLVQFGISKRLALDDSFIQPESPIAALPPQHLHQHAIGIYDAVQ